MRFFYLVPSLLTMDTKRDSLQSNRNSIYDGAVFANHFFFITAASAVYIICSFTTSLADVMMHIPCAPVCMGMYARGMHVIYM